MKMKTLIRTLIIMTIIMVAASFYYLPFYVTKPGDAHELGSNRPSRKWI